MLKVTAVVPAYNCENTIKGCLESLINQTRKFDEIIVVDDGSTDSTPEILEKIESVKVIKTTHVGRSAARNIGLKHTTTEIVFFVEADAIYSKEFVEKCIRHFNNPKVGGVIGKLEVWNLNSVWTLCKNAELKARFSNYKPFSGWMYKKKILDEIGGFNESLSVGEDRDVGKRVLEMGYKIVYEPEAVWYHREPEKLLDILRKRFGSGREIVKFYRLVGVPKLALVDLMAFSSLALSVIFPVMGLIFLGYIMAHLFFVKSYFKHISKRFWPYLAVYLVAGRLSYVLGRFIGFAEYGIPMRISSTLLD